MRAHFMLWEQFIRPSLKAVRTLVIRPLQGYGNTASFSYPDTWVRKPDCLHLAYSPLLGTWPATQACALTGNRTGDPLVHRSVFNPLSHTSQG